MSIFEYVGFLSVRQTNLPIWQFEKQLF